jgi:hypothetical protein
VIVQENRKLRNFYVEPSVVPPQLEMERAFVR